MRLEILNVFSKEVDISPEALIFLQEKALVQKFEPELIRLRAVFGGPERITVSLVKDPEVEAEGSERIVFEIRCGLDRRDFNWATERFMTPLQFRNSELYRLICILHDL